MADFKTHLICGTAASGAAATSLLIAGALPRDAALGCFALGAIGSLLPDVDLDHSIPARVAFRVVSLVGAFMVVLALSPHFSLAELIVAWAASYLALRHGLFGLINTITVHRGLVHSLPAATAFALATVSLTYHLLDCEPRKAWLGGLFVGGGFLVHLLLDELFSVDLLGRRLKRSFGTAVCLGDLRNPLGTLALYAGNWALYRLCPPDGGLWRLLIDHELYRRLALRLLPAQGWFDGLASFAGESLRRLL